MSADCILTTTVGRDLMSEGEFILQNLKTEKPELGQVVVTRVKRNYIFHLFVREKYDDKVFMKNVELTMNALKQAVEALDVKSFSVSKNGNGLNNVSWVLIEKMFRAYFGKDGYQITVCAGTVVIPSEAERPLIIAENHDSVVGGHKGETKTYERIRESYYWKNMKDDIHNYIQTCSSCQKKKLVRVKTKQPMQITDTPTKVFEKLQMDIVGPLPETETGNRYILTWQDCLSKYSGGIPLSNVEAPTIAVAFAEAFICLYGCPESVQTDQGSQFLSSIMANVAKIFRIKQFKSTSFHPQSLGSLERSHHTFVEYLKHYCTQVNWDLWLPFAMFSFNTSLHESTGFTPYEVVFGNKARMPSEFKEENVPLTYVALVDNLLNRLTETQAMVADRLEAAKRRCKKYYDRKLNEMNFKVGQHVYLLKEPRISKFDDHYEGPFIINKIFNDHNVELQINSSKTKVVHMDKLKHAFLRFDE